MKKINNLIWIVQLTTLALVACNRKSQDEDKLPQVEQTVGPEQTAGPSPNTPSPEPTATEIPKVEGDVPVLNLNVSVANSATRTINIALDAPANSVHAKIWDAQNSEYGKFTAFIDSLKTENFELIFHGNEELNFNKYKIQIAPIKITKVEKKNKSDWPQFWQQFKKLPTEFFKYSELELSEAHRLPAILLESYDAIAPTESLHAQIYHSVGCASEVFAREISFPKYILDIFDSALCDDINTTEYAKFGLSFTQNSFISFKEDGKPIDPKYISQERLLSDLCPEWWALNQEWQLKIMSGLKKSGWISQDATIFNARSQCLVWVQKNIYPKLLQKLESLVSDGEYNALNNVAKSVVNMVTSRTELPVPSAEELMQKIETVVLAPFTKSKTAMKNAFRFVTDVNEANLKSLFSEGNTSAITPEKIVDAYLKPSIGASAFHAELDAMPAGQLTAIKSKYAKLLISSCSNGVPTFSCVKKSALAITSYKIVVNGVDTGMIESSIFFIQN